MRFAEAITSAAEQPLFAMSTDAMLLLDSKGCIQTVNPAVPGVTGYRQTSLLHKTFVSFLEPEHICAFSKGFHEAMQGQASTQQAQFRHADGHMQFFELRIIPWTHDTGRLVYIVMKDMTELKLASQMIHHIAYHDTLTGLSNRTMFQIELTRRIAAFALSRKPFSVLLIQLDRFQIITDSLGHNAGDLLIKMVSERLEGYLSDDEHVSRTGSNEFAMLYATPEEPLRAAEKLDSIYERLTRPYQVHDEAIYLQVRMGSAQYPRDGVDMTALLRNAAMTRSVESAWDVVPGTEGRHRAADRLTLENDLRKALERGEFEVYYQPQYEIHTNRLTGMEALVRWSHPERGLVAPGEFIPAAEETGLIIPIGEWVLREACEQTKRWHDMGYGKLTVSVNLSIRQFRKMNLIGDIYRIVRETGMDPALLELEITESMAMEDMNRVIRKLEELKQLGIRISMDDFGTGYSSLHYLKKIPIHKLKIDQSFIRDIASDRDSAAIVATIIAMARHLKLEVVAEGVETAEDLLFLKEQQCGKAQGYFFSKPLPGKEFELLLQAIRPVLV